jgi:hypothetical protein
VDEGTKALKARHSTARGTALFFSAPPLVSINNVFEALKGRDRRLR